jgi:hypothetical protein
MSTKRYWTPPALAERWGVSPEKVIGFITRGELLAVNFAERLDGRPRWRISEEAIEAFLLARTAQPRPARRKRRTETYPHYV